MHLQSYTGCNFYLDFSSPKDFFLDEALFRVKRRLKSENTFTGFRFGFWKSINFGFGSVRDFFGRLTGIVGYPIQT